MPERKLRWAAVLVVAGIVYGTLYPFQFYWFRGSFPLALETLLSTWRVGTSRGDLLANIILYVPFGLVLGFALPIRSRLQRILCVTALGALLSMVLETLQFWEIERSSVLVDVYANTAGAFAGVAASLLPNTPLLGPKTMPDQRALFVLACWLASEWSPFVPQIDLHKYWRAIKPVLAGAHFSLEGLVSAAAIWCVLGALVEATAGLRFARLLLPLLFAVDLAGRILIADLVLSPSGVWGGCIGMLVWLLLISRWPARNKIALSLLMLLFVLKGLAPFHFSAPGHSFDWIPFDALIQGDPEHVARALFWKLFLYGATLWLLVRAGLGHSIASLLTGLMVLAISIVHLFIPGRSSEITDVCLVGILSFTFYMLQSSRAAPLQPAAAVD